MSNRIKAKANLKKSLYFSGSIAFVAAATGIAVAVPTYNKIQDALNKNLTKLSDLSRFMTQLTAKLGVSADTKFSQQLSDGYEISYSNGKTQIYKTIDGAKTLVMNMNRDGTIGSAASMTGLAAQKMLSVITEAHATLGDDVKAMDDILGPYVDAAETKSMEIESAITGMSKDEIIARNALATNDASEKAKAITELKAQGISDESLHKAEAAAKAQKEEQHKLESLANDDTARQAELEKQRLKAEAEFQAKQSQLKGAYVDFMISDKVIAKYSESDRSSLMAKDLEVLRNEFERLQGEILEKKNAEASAKTTVHQVEKATTSGGGSASGVVSRILANPSSFMNTFAASFGFDDGKGNSKSDTPQLRRLFYNQLHEEGVSDSSFELMLNFFGHNLLDIPLSELSNWKSFGHISTKPSVKANFNEIINTYLEERQDISRILGVSLRLTYPDGTIKNGYIFSRASNKNILDLEKIIPVIPSFPIDKQPYGFTVTEAQDTYETLDLLIKVIASKVFPDIKMLGYKTLANILDHGVKLKPVHDQSMVIEITKFAAYIDSIHDDEWKKSIATTIAMEIGERILIKGENVDFRSDSLVKAFELAVSLDTEYEPSIITGNVDDIYKDASTHTYLNELINYIFDKRNGDKKDLSDKWSKIYDFIKDRSSLKIELQDVIKDKKLFKAIVDSNNLSLIKGLNSLDGNASEIFSSLLNAGTKHDVFIKAIKSTLGTTPISESLLQDHINQLHALKTKIEWNEFMSTNANFTLITLLSSKPDVTYSFLDANDIVKVASGFDISIKENADKVSSASGVSAAMASQSISADDTKKIKDKVIQIIAKTHLTTDQFKEVVKYTNTVFDVVSNDAAGKSKAIARLLTVLDPTKIQENIAKIITFNKWVEGIRKEKAVSGDTSPITEDEIETYAWTSIPSFQKENPTDADGNVVVGFTGFAFDGTHIYATKHSSGKLYVIDNPDTDAPFSMASADIDTGWTSSSSFINANGHKYVLAVKLDRSKLVLVDVDTKKTKVIPLTSASADDARSIATDVAGNIYMLSSSGEILKSTKTLSQYLVDTPWASSDLGTMIFEKKVDKPSGVTFDTFMVSSSFIKDGKTMLAAIAGKGDPKLYIWDLSKDTPTYVAVDAPRYTPAGTTTEIGLLAYNIVVSPPQNGVLYAYIMDKFGNLWRINISTVSTTKLDATILFNLKDMKDQDGNPITLPTTDQSRAINYDPSQTGKGGHQISIFWSNYYFTLHDNTKEVEDIFNFLKP